MTYEVFMQRLDVYADNLLFEVFDEDHNLIAEVKKDASQKTRLYYKENVYEFPFSIKSIVKPEFSFPYPVCSKKTTKLGYQIKKNSEVIAEYYGETAVVEKRKLFSKKISFKVYKYNDNVYYMVTVGLPRESSHYYCLIDAKTHQTVGMIERMQANKENIRSKIHIIEQDKTELMLMVLADETVMTVTSNAEGQIIDMSAGKYVSIRQEERDFFDIEFLNKAKQN